MKKAKLAFLAVAIIAICSAFATTPPPGDPYQKVGTNDYVLLDITKKGVPVAGGWRCIEPLEPVCTYTIKEGITPHNPLIDADMEELEDGTLDLFPFN